MELRELSERVQYLQATEDPLSADIGIVHGDRFDWVFDVGYNNKAFETIQGIDKKKNIILSHFHKDHVGNIERISYDNMYCGHYTKTKLGFGTVVQSSTSYYDGIKLTIFSIPSTHSKGTVGLEVNEKYAFLGDAIYGALKKDKVVYNANVLKEMITALESLKAQQFLISHDSIYTRSKESIICELKELYHRRKPGESFIFLEG